MPLYSQYYGGTHGGTGVLAISNNACAISIDESKLIYFGGNGGGTSKLNINNTACVFTIDESILIFKGGNGGGTSKLNINNTACVFTIDETLLIYKGGNGGGTSRLTISTAACPEPAPMNIFLGGVSSAMSATSLISNTNSNTTGPYIATLNDSTIVNGNCITLTTTGTGATGYNWSPSTGLSDPSIQNPVAKPSVTTTYTVMATGNTAGCRDIAKVTITVLGNSSVTSIAYPSKICNTTTTLQAPVLTGITNGTFSADNSGLKIDPSSGLISPSTSTVGVYSVTYAYGNCNESISATVEITNDCATNIGVVEYPSIYAGGLAAISIPKSTLLQAACTPNIDYTQLIYAGGVAAISIPKSTLLQAACTPNLDYTQLIYTGGNAAPLSANSTLIQGACTPNLDYTQLIYTGGAASINSPKSILLQAACSVPVGDNFYLGGVGVGYGNGSLTPSTSVVTGTAVAATSDITICPGTPTVLGATGATSYTWTPATGLNNTLVANPIASPTTTTTYTVIGTGANVGCINTAKVTVTVIQDAFTTVSYGAYNFDEEDLNLKKVNYINGPLNGTFASSPSGLSFSTSDGSFTPGLSNSGMYAINYAYTKGACNYNYITNINITKLPPTITYITPAKFFINYDGISLTPTNSGGTAEIFELMDVLPVGLSFNTTTGIITGTPTQLVDNLAVRVRAANYRRDASINWSEITTISISVKKPTITLAVANITSLNTSYGLPSTTTNFLVQAENIIDYVLVIAPTGFETSVLANSGFSDATKMYPTAERYISQPLYVRLKRTTPVGNHSGNIQLTSTSADGVALSTSTSYVAPATLTITGKYFQKFYGSKITLGAGSRYYTATGLMNEETIGSVTIAASGGTGIDDAVGYYTITPSSATGGTFSSSNYNITYNPGQFQVVYSLYNFNMTGTSSNWVKGTVPIPKITNLIVSNITKTSATIAGKIPNSFVNIEEYGICYSTSINPKITDQKIANNTTVPGAFSFDISNLSIGTKYFARAYVTIGNTTFYSPNMRFKTLNPAIGDAYLGGKLAYILQVGDPGYDPDVLHGLIAANTDNPAKAWGCYGTAIAGANGTAIGTGLQNTNDIVNLCASTTSAAYYCSQLTSNGYSDWYLPSKDEMLLLYNAGNQIGGFVANGWYITSSQYNSTKAWILDFATNPAQGRLHPDWKDWSITSRAVRSF